MKVSVKESFEALKRYVEKEEYKGWDPYDGLSSRVFRAIPFIRDLAVVRLAWIQLFKRNPVNLRRIALVPKDFNAKGIGLFTTAYCNLYTNNPTEDTLHRIHYLADLLLKLRSPGYSGSCWGYYFDWQARAFFQPANMPTVVATSFVADALLNAYAVTGKQAYRDAAVSSAEFVLHDLNRTKTEKGICFSYSPLDQSQVFNASLLGARLLARIYSVTGNKQLLEPAREAVRFVCLHQQESGAWAYGNQSFHKWVDSFHTGFNLECIYEYGMYTGDQSFSSYLEKGLNYYLHNFFTEEGVPKYYDNKTYPIDIHAPAQLIVSLARMQRFQENSDLCRRVMEWTIRNMQDSKGFFYYQKKKGISSKIPYMRWAQAWMFYAMSYYLNETKQAENK